MGGLLSLGFGFSVISAIEIAYYTLIRWHFKKYPQKQPTSPNDGPVPRRRGRKTRKKMIKVYPKLDTQQEIYSIPILETIQAKYVPS